MWLRRFFGCSLLFLGGELGGDSRFLDAPRIIRVLIRCDSSQRRYFRVPKLKIGCGGGKASTLLFREAPKYISCLLSVHRMVFFRVLSCTF